MRSIPHSLLLLASVQFLLASDTPAQNQEYELVIIEPWNTSYSLATSRASDINNRNQVSGSASPISGPSSFLWTSQGGKQSIDLAGQLNDQGVIVGLDAIRYPDGTIELFDLLSVGEDVNENNVVAGTFGTLTCGLSTTDEAGVWDAGQGTQLLQSLGVLAAEHARAINDFGEVVGVRSSTGQCGDFEAFWFDLTTNQHIDLHALLVGSGGGLTQAFDINEPGFVVGEGPQGGTVRPFLWHPSSGFQFLPTVPGSTPLDTHYHALNNHNQAVGMALVSDGTSLGEWRAILWDSARGARDLNRHTRKPSNFTIDEAKKINDNGWIIGRGHYGSWSPERAVVLIPMTPIGYR